MPNKHKSCSSPQCSVQSRGGPYILRTYRPERRILGEARRFVVSWLALLRVASECPIHSRLGCRLMT